jgi:hypothetical protein
MPDENFRCVAIDKTGTHGGGILRRDTYVARNRQPYGCPNSPIDFAQDAFPSGNGHEDFVCRSGEDSRHQPIHTSEKIVPDGLSRINRECHFVEHDPDWPATTLCRNPQAKREIQCLEAVGVRHILNQQPSCAGNLSEMIFEQGNASGSKVVGQPANAYASV